MDAVGRLVLFAIIGLEVFTYADPIENNEHNSRRERFFNPISNLFSELGDFLLDVDQAVSVQTAPKIRLEDRLIASLVGPRQPRSRLFQKVQENYRHLNRLGENNQAESQTRNHQAANVISNEVQRVLDSLPLTQILQPREQRPAHPRPTKPQSLNKENKDTENLLHRIEAVQEEERREKILHDIRETIQKLAIDPKGPEKFLDWLGPKSNFHQDNRGSVIADALFSEAETNQNVKRFLKRHGSWIFDFPFLRRWRDSLSKAVATTEQSTVSEETSTQVSTTVESTSLAAPVEQDENADFVERRMSLEDTGDPTFYEVNNVAKKDYIEIELNPQVISNDIHDLNSKEPPYTEIIAFSFTGLPLKLKIDSRIENPAMYLHRILKSAGVGIYIPVESFEELEPAGKEVFSLGVRSGNVSPASFDLSDDNGVKFFVSILKSKIFTKKRS